jgi:hypothetical protein
MTGHTQKAVLAALQRLDAEHPENQGWATTPVIALCTPWQMTHTSTVRPALNRLRRRGIVERRKIVADGHQQSQWRIVRWRVTRRP